MSTQALRERLRSVLENESRCARELIDLIERERTALSSRDAGALEAAIAGKQARLEQLEARSRERDALVRAAGFATDRSGVEACIAGCDGDGTLAALWGEFIEHVSECRKANQVNGGVVELSRRQVRRALGILRGQAPDTELYNTEGRSVAGGNTRPLAKA